MPIRPSKLQRYPADWEDISRRIRFERAQGRCECSGQCGADHAGRCPELHGQQALWTSKPVRVFLTTAHLDHIPENNSDSNLLGLCQRCHLVYDAQYHHREWWRLRQARLEEAGQIRLLERAWNAVQLWLFGHATGHFEPPEHRPES